MTKAISGVVCCIVRQWLFIKAPSQYINRLLMLCFDYHGLKWVDFAATLSYRLTGAKLFLSRINKG
jgi:hypothetical protein